MPRYTDALAGLYAASASTVPLDVPVNYYAPGGGSGKAGRAVLTMALVPGPNYEKLRAYLAQAGKDAASASDDLQVQPVLTQAIEIVKERYPWIELTDDLATAQKRDVSLTLVLDIRSRLGRAAGDPTAVQIEVIAFNDQHKPVSRVVTEGKAGVGSASGYGFQAAAKQALDGLNAKSAAVFN
jgi:hypothetical protein